MKPIEPLLIEWIKPFYPDIHFGVTVPPDLLDRVAPLTPVVRIVRATGGVADLVIDEPVIDVDVFGVSEVSAANWAGVMQDLFNYQLPRTTVDGVNFGRTKIIAGPRWRPSEDLQVRRYGATFQLYAHNA